MILKTLQIQNGSQEFLNLVNKLKADKEAKVQALLSKKRLKRASSRFQMSLNKSITIVTTEGHEYILGFSNFDSIVLPESISKKVVEIVIATTNNHSINNAKTLFTFAKTIKSYLAVNDVILYSYCDHKEIERGKKHQHLTPQEFRSLLFQTMFNREADKDFVNRPIELVDAVNEKHCIHLFARTESVDALETACSELYKLNK